VVRQAHHNIVTLSLSKGRRKTSAPLLLPSLNNIYSVFRFLVLLTVQEELLEIVDTNGNPLGIAPRSSMHGNPSLLHKVVHVLVFNSAGELLLQKRSMSKDVAPGKWDTSVGGHVSPAEDQSLAAHREMKEELGVDTDDLIFLHSYIYSNTYESELVFTYFCSHDGPFSFNAEEIDAIKFWRQEDICNTLGTGIFSGQFEAEFAKYLAHTPRSSGP